MAEKKFGDMIIGLLIGIFVLGVFSVAIFDFDSQFTNNENLGVNLTSLYNDSSADYTADEVELWQNTNNGSVFSITAGSDVDVRGTSQAILATKESPSTMTDFIRNVGGLIITHKLITGLIISMIIVIGLILFIRFLRPGGA